MHPVFSFLQYSAGTAALLQQMEKFCGNLASALPYLKRDFRRYRRATDSILPPYTILTPNIGTQYMILLELRETVTINCLNFY